MSDTLMSMDAPLDNLACPHFALLYIDENGKLRFEASPSIANDCHSILSPEVTHSFLRAVALSGDGTKLFNSSEFNLEAQGGRSPLSPDSSGTPSLSRRSSVSQHTDNHHGKRKRVSHECLVPMSITCYPKTTLPIRSQSLLRRYYEKAFDSLQQTNCRILAKAYIKLVEPRKQVNYPYNGRKVISGSPQQFDPEMTKPAWWPAGVTHREPDHLRKPERIRLLVHILCELRESHDICVEKLKEADQSIRRQISPVERLQVLDEIYRVRGEEESYLDGTTDGQAVVCVSRVHLPDMADAQTSLYSPSGSILESDNIYREEIPDLESHTSVFASSNSSSSPASDVSVSQKEVEATPPLSTPQTVVPTTWDACHPTISASLPPITTAIKHPGADGAATPYPLEYSTSSISPHHEPTPTMEMPTFAMEYYATPHPHLAHHIHHQSSRHGQDHLQTQPQTSMSVMRPPASTHPYYFDY